MPPTTTSGRHATPPASVTAARTAEEGGRCEALRRPHRGNPRPRHRWCPRRARDRARAPRRAGRPAPRAGRRREPQRAGIALAGRGGGPMTTVHEPSVHELSPIQQARLFLTALHCTAGADALIELRWRLHTGGMGRRFVPASDCAVTSLELV